MPIQQRADLANPPDSGDRSAWNATEGLAQMGQVAVPALIEALRSENPVVRRNAAYAFYRMPRGQGKDAVPALIEATRDKVADVRRGAAVMAQTVPYLPAGVHVVVIDPGVGTRSRAIALAAVAIGDRIRKERKRKAEAVVPLAQHGP